MQIHVMLNGRESMNRALAGGASILIVPGNVDKVSLVPVDIDLEHHARMIGRAAGERRRGTVETKFRKVELINEGIYDPDWIVLPDGVIDAFGKQCDLLAVIAFNESLHESPGLSALIQFRRSMRFHTPSATFGHLLAFRTDV
jgi:hypothetical protein